MKIAIITSGLLPIPASKGGAIETLVDSFIKENELQKKFQITVYSLSEKKAKQIVKKNHYRFCKYVYAGHISSFIIRVMNKLLKKNMPINKYYQKKVIKLIRRSNYDYIIVENYPELTLSLSDKRVIPYLHSDVLNIDTPNGKSILESCYKVITVSDFIKDRVLEIDKTYSDKVFTVYNSIDFAALSDKQKADFRKEIRKKYNIKENDFVYAFSGRISKEKGPLELVKAFHKIIVPHKKLLIIGGVWYGSKKSNSYLEELKSLSNEDIIYTGYVPHSDILKTLCAIDVGVVPSNCNEAAGLSVVEFMNVGATVVAADKGGIKEYINAKDNFLVDYKSESEFINELSIALEKSYKTHSDSKKKKNIEYSKKFSIEENYKSIVNIVN